MTVYILYAVLVFFGVLISATLLYMQHNGLDTITLTYIETRASDWMERKSVDIHRWTKGFYQKYYSEVPDWIDEWRDYE